MEHIAISVIVPIYNTKPYLAECIESILDQKINVPIEVLLIDDGSTDGCAEICDKYAARDERVRVIHQENQGLSAARNAGIDNAKGRYYSFVDSDDVVLPRFLQTLYDACEEHDAYMSLCSVEDVQEDGKSCDLRKLMALMGMGVKQGDTVTVKVEGDDEEAAAAAIQKFLTENV